MQKILILSSILFLGLFGLPLSALEENFDGAWEYSGVVENAEGTVSWNSRLDFQGGTFELNYLTELDFDLHPEWTVDDKGLLEMLEESWPPLNTISLQGNGTYAVDGDSLWMYFDEVDWRYNEDSIIEFYAKFIGNLAYGSDELTVEEIRELERESGNEVLVLFEQENLLEILNEHHRYTYTVEGETLFLSVNDREKLFLKNPAGAKSLGYQRVDSATAVAPTTWGALKATLAP